MAEIRDSEVLSTHSPHRYPWWLAFLLTSPIRRAVENPRDTLQNTISAGQVVLELGPANGFYSVPIAESLGPQGKLIAVDVQPQMLRMLARRLRRRGLEARLAQRLTEHVEQELGDLRGTVDVVVAINVIHELPKPRETIHALAQTLRAGGEFLLVEPRGHVRRELFEAELAWAHEAGLERVEIAGMIDRRGYHARLRKVVN